MLCTELWYVDPVGFPWLSVPLRPEAILRIQHPSQQTLNICQLSPQRAGPAGVCLLKQWWAWAWEQNTSWSVGFNECGVDCLFRPAERPVYNLYAVSNHAGNALGGHYTAYCRHPGLGEWYSYNDTRYHHSTSYAVFWHDRCKLPVWPCSAACWEIKWAWNCFCALTFAHLY